MSESKSVNRCNLHILVEHPDPGLNLPVNDGPEFNVNDGPDFNVNDGPEFNGNDGPEFNGNDCPEIDTNVSNIEFLSGMKGNESLTDTNNSLILGTSPIRPLASPTQKDMPAEKRGKLHITSTTSKIDSTPVRQSFIKTVNSLLIKTVFRQSRWFRGQLRYCTT